MSWRRRKATERRAEGETPNVGLYFQIGTIANEIRNLAKDSDDRHEEQESRARVRHEEVLRAIRDRQEKSA